MRVYGDDVDVTLADRPVSFIWRGRRYVVREVIDCWVERTPWWRLALIGDEQTASPSMQEQVWRVEATPGRLVSSYVAGVYDLACSEAGRWQLRRVCD